MNFVVATACIKMKMTPEEAINAVTINVRWIVFVFTEAYHQVKKASLLSPNHSFHLSVTLCIWSNLI
jgi:imidazolonepropionase